jgi:hypothetical protein
MHLFVCTLEIFGKVQLYWYYYYHLFILFYRNNSIISRYMKHDLEKQNTKNTGLQA